MTSPFICALNPTAHVPSVREPKQGGSFQFTTWLKLVNSVAHSALTYSLNARNCSLVHSFFIASGLHIFILCGAAISTNYFTDSAIAWICVAKIGNCYCT